MNAESKPTEQLLIGQLTKLLDTMYAHAAEHRHLAVSCAAGHQSSVENLLHYLALRQHDIRPLQQQLTQRGLSSLGRSESHVVASVQHVITALEHMAGTPGLHQYRFQPCPNMEHGRKKLESNTRALLGAPPSERSVRIMVTMPGEAAHDYELVRGLLNNGMNCMRINCAHDGPVEWEKMVAHLARARKETGLPCKVMMDLGGPKLRTGPIEPGPAVLKWSPERDAFGSVLQPARVCFHQPENPLPTLPSIDAWVPIGKGWIASTAVGNSVHLTDARGASRKLRIIEQKSNYMLAESTETTYVVPGTKLEVENHEPGVVGTLKQASGTLTLKKGDRLNLTRDENPGTPARYAPDGRIERVARISFAPIEIFGMVKVGESIWFDDGKIGGLIERVCENHIEVRITNARPGGSKLGADKGINLPESELTLPALTPADLSDLAHVARLADIVALSFVHQPEDVFQLMEHLKRLKAEHLGIVLKIETRRGFANLPGVLLTALRWPAAGVMIARGDLAVECGFERLAEVQEEILWICEAAHVPAIWATQVLETLAKKGIPSRAEITDAAMSVRAECVMLNKGPYILDAIQALDGILQRMQMHQNKKNTLLRQLKSWGTL